MHYFGNKDGATLPAAQLFFGTEKCGWTHLVLLFSFDGNDDDDGVSFVCLLFTDANMANVTCSK